MFTEQNVRVSSVLLHDFPGAALSSNIRAELKKNTLPPLLHHSSSGPTSAGQRRMKNATNIQPLTTAAHHNSLMVT